MISFSENELENARVLINDTNGKLLPADRNDDIKIIDNKRETTDIQPNDSIGIDINSNEAAVSLISLQLSAFDTEYALRSVVLKIVFDGNQTVWVPAGDFFGTGYKLTTSPTWNSSVNGKMVMESYWLMPFRKSCNISLVNHGDQTVNADLIVKISDYKWKSNSMYFGASWHEYHQIMTAGSELTGGTGRHRDINFIDIKGKGVYSGDAVSVYNTVDTYAIPFKSSISSNIELWHWLPAIINYSLTTYWYVLLPYEINIKPDRENAGRPVPIDPEKPL